ncbi:MAG: ATP-binding cassette domain-containing protein [Paludibacteraceae bacterium]|nr:ATP-binding cassette domain-containing protein [Paludibacteraceae bacterium]
MKLIEVKDVVKQYSGHRALDGVSLDVPKGTIYGLLGPNGAGKTTLIRIINCITAPDSGEVLLNGKILQPGDVRNIGYLPEERGLYKKMKVGEQAVYLARLKGMTKADALRELKYWFEKFEIQDWWYKKVEELSKGMAQKVQFITTILHKPDLLIFDEPFSGFDPVNTDLLKREILDLRNQGATIIFSTHNMESVEELCENISLVNKAKIVLQGNVAEIRSNYASDSLFVKTADVISFDNNVRIISQTEKNNSIETVLKKMNGKSNNEILQEIITQTSVISFEELLPTMNDIFIRTVKGEA